MVESEEVNALVPVFSISVVQGVGISHLDGTSPYGFSGWFGAWVTLQPSELVGTGHSGYLPESGNADFFFFFFLSTFDSVPFIF